MYMCIYIYIYIFVYAYTYNLPPINNKPPLTKNQPFWGIGLLTINLDGGTITPLIKNVVWSNPPEY